MQCIWLMSIGESKQFLVEEVYYYIGRWIIDGMLVVGECICDVDVVEELYVLCILVCEVF